MQLVLNLAFHSEEGAIAATRSFEALKTALESQPWVVEVVGRNSKEFPDGKGIYSDGYVVLCDMSKVVRDAGKAKP